MKAPEITVIITAYNLERYLDTCLRELAAQTFQDFEVLVVDDCSTDRTAVLAGEWREKCPERFSVISTPENLGSPAKSRNFALDSGLIHGKYLIFLDGDDTIEPDFLSALHGSAEKTGAEITLCAYDRFEEETGHVLCREMQGFPGEIDLPPESDILAFINGSLWNKLVLSGIVGDLRLPDFKVGEDVCFSLALYGRCRKVACVGRILIHYRVRRASVISNTDEKTIHFFADEIVRLYEGGATPWMRDTLAVAVLIHIGVSMPLRAYGNPEIDMRKLLGWIEEIFSERFRWFRGLRWLSLGALLKHGVKGFGLWAAKVCYRLHIFPAYLWLYRFVTKILHIDIKF